VCDRLSQLGCSRAIGIDFGSAADRADMGDAGAKYANKRAEMWGFMKDWLRLGCIPDDADLIADLGNVEYGYNGADALVLERKDDMRRRGLASPDDGDALALTFAARRAAGLARGTRLRGVDAQAEAAGGVTTDPSALLLIRWRPVAKVRFTTTAGGSFHVRYSYRGSDRRRGPVRSIGRRGQDPALASQGDALTMDPHSQNEGPTTAMKSARL